MTFDNRTADTSSLRISLDRFPFRPAGALLRLRFARCRGEFMSREPGDSRLSAGRASRATPFNSPDKAVVGPADIAALAIHLMTNTAIIGATYDIDGGQQLVEG
jgi:hypothetical protein